MISVLNDTDMSEMQITRTHIEWVRRWINQRSLRCRPRHDNPVPASDLCFQKSITENRYDRDRIEDEDKQHHGVGHGRIRAVFDRSESVWDSLRTRFLIQNPCW